MSETKVLTERSTRTLIQKIMANNSGSGNPDGSSNLDDITKRLEDVINKLERIENGGGSIIGPRPTTPTAPSLYTPTPLEHYSSYEVDEDRMIITLKQYLGPSDSNKVYQNIIIPRSYKLDGRYFQVVLYGSVYKEKSNYISSVLIEDGVIIGNSADGMFRTEDPTITNTTFITIKFTIGDIDTSLVTDMRYMFGRCGMVSDRWYINNVDNYINPSYLSFDSAVNLDYMFYGFKSSNITLFFPDSTKIISMYGMFSGSIACRYCITNDNCHIDMPELTSMKQMFEGAGDASPLDKMEIDLSSLYSNNIIDCSSMFKEARVNNELTVDLSNLNIYGYRSFFNVLSPSIKLAARTVTNAYDMFYNCVTVTSIDLTQADFSNCINADNMFYRCAKLQEVLVSRDKWLPEGCSNTKMFYDAGCTSVTFVD